MHEKYFFHFKNIKRRKKERQESGNSDGMDIILAPTLPFFSLVFAPNLIFCTTYKSAGNIKVAIFHEVKIKCKKKGKNAFTFSEYFFNQWEFFIGTSFYLLFFFIKIAKRLIHSFNSNQVLLSISL